MQATAAGPRAAVIGLVALLATLLPAATAGASVGGSMSITIPNAVGVGQERIGSFTIANVNTPPHGDESSTITQLRLAPSCASTGTAQNPCTTPDPGVLAVELPGTGAAGTACAGRTFAVSARDASGVVTLTASSPVVLAPPGSGAGADRCTVNYTFRVLKMPTVDGSTNSGLQTHATVSGQLTGGASALVTTAFASIETIVVRGVPKIFTQASPSVQVDDTISDTAYVEGVAGIAAPSGSVMFQVYGPDDPGCVLPQFAFSTNGLTPKTAISASATSDEFPVRKPGLYRFVASYRGDASYVPVLTPCNLPGQDVTVTAAPVDHTFGDFDGNGTSDIATFKPRNGTAYLRTSSPMAILWGQVGDIPVSGDFDGNGVTDVAVFRPANNAWYIRTPIPSFVNWGGLGDIPVPGDYDGNGTTDVAVFRPATGTWYLHGPSARAVQWGALGDIPVPADYDGDGATDIAVFRAATGSWYVNTEAPRAVKWGGLGDIPVPADYDGNGTTDIAVFRPLTGTWYLLTPTARTVSWGIVGDLPVAADYDGNGTTDVAVFRPLTGTWFVKGRLPVVWGGLGDRPILMPPALQALFFV